MKLSPDGALRRELVPLPPWMKLVGLVVLLVVVAWMMVRLQSVPESTAAAVSELHPAGVMGTSCTLLRVHAADEPAGLATPTLQEAEAEIRRLESLFSLWIEESELSRFNRDPVTEPLAVSAELGQLLAASRELHDVSDGAFDVTLRPLVELWREAGALAAPPTAEAIQRAREASSWDLLALADGTATRLAPTVRVDLDGIAKGSTLR